MSKYPKAVKPALRRKPSNAIQAWERKFRAAFERDGGSAFDVLIKRFGLWADAREMLDGTIDFVIATVALAQMDGAAVDEFLANQSYSGQGSTAVYALTFDLAGRGAARLLVRPDLRIVDLADLYDYPWHRIQMSGYSQLWVSRIDDLDLEPSEIEELDRLVTYDIRFDMNEDEVLISFDHDSYEGALAITVDDTPEVLRGQSRVVEP
jgi:hypothetical protein